MQPAKRAISLDELISVPFMEPDPPREFDLEDLRLLLELEVASLRTARAYRDLKEEYDQVNKLLTEVTKAKDKAAQKQREVEAALYQHRKAMLDKLPSLANGTGR
jgi:hypothetical protein